MSAADKAQIIVLGTGLYPDRGTVDAALETIGADMTIKRIDLEPRANEPGAMGFGC